MPLHAHEKRQTVYRGITTHHHWKDTTHHEFKPSNHKVLLILGGLLCLAIIILGLASVS